MRVYITQTFKTGGTRYVKDTEYIQDGYRGGWAVITDRKRSFKACVPKHLISTIKPKGT